ncbi:MAG: 30S ribosomal protein S12 methylthiotransferase RimO [Clostridiales bacterium]|nr:30S ribosomal protein S12 methylthiotransferase RimO [Clostridiales bacterium]
MTKPVLSGAPLSVGMISLGCNKNRVDSETALGLLAEHGYVFTGDPAEADILMVNTCGFIESAKEESIDAIFELAEYKKTGKCRLLVVTGCLAQRYEGALLEEIPEIDLLMGVNQYQELPAAIEKALAAQDASAPRSYCHDDYTYYAHDRVLTTPAYSAYTRIGEGCSNRCTFCAIPLIRGPYRSRPMEDVLAEIEQLARQGVKEHILVAQDTTRFGTDEGGHTTLPELLEKAAAIPGVEWLRVLYCYPDETDDRLLDVIANTPNICKYLDLPIQHVNDTVLRRMHRRGDKADILRCIRGARERGLTLRTSIIVGFPGETEEQFQELLDVLREAEFDRLGAFTYSPEEDTPAARLPEQIPEEIKQERLDRLMTMQQEISLKRNQARIGTVEKVLVTAVDEDGRLLGRSHREAPETDGEILFTLPKGAELPAPGTFVNVRITQADTYDLMGVME